MNESLRWALVHRLTTVGEWCHRRASALAGQPLRLFGMIPITSVAGRQVYESLNGQVLVLAPSDDPEVTKVLVQVTEYGIRASRAYLSMSEVARLVQGLERWRTTTDFLGRPITWGGPV